MKTSAIIGAWFFAAVRLFLKMKPVRLVSSWVPVIVWMLIMFTASTDLMSAEHTSRIIGPILHWLAPNISADTVATMQFLTRKLAHLTEYALLAMLLWRAFRRSLSAQTHKGWTLAAFSMAVFFAASDEYHQSFVNSRTASVRDVLIDTGGAAIGLVICQLLFRTRSGIDPADPVKTN